MDLTQSVLGGIAIRNTSFLRQGNLHGVKYAAIIIGTRFILAGLSLWVYAVSLTILMKETEENVLGDFIIQWNWYVFLYVFINSQKYIVQQQLLPS